MTIIELNTLIQTYRPRRKHIITIWLLCAFLIFAPDSWLLFLLRSPHPILTGYLGLIFLTIASFLIVGAMIGLAKRISSGWASVQSRLPDTNIFKVKK